MVGGLAKKCMADISSPMHSNRSVAKQVSDFHQGTSCLPSTVQWSIVLGPSVCQLRSGYWEPWSKTLWYCSSSSSVETLVYWCIGLESYLQESCGFPEVASAVLHRRTMWKVLV